MVALYPDFQKFKEAKAIAREAGLFIVERGRPGPPYLLYRECRPKNVFVGKRSTVDGILQLVRKVAAGVKA